MGGRVFKDLGVVGGVIEIQYFGVGFHHGSIFVIVISVRLYFKIGNDVIFDFLPHRQHFRPFRQIDGLDVVD